MLQPAHQKVPRMEHGPPTSMMPGTHIETSPVSRMNAILDERVRIPETDVMDKCEFYEKFINELAPFMTREDEQDYRDALEFIKIEAVKAMGGKKSQFVLFSQEMESELRRLKNDLENKKVIR